MGSDFKNLQKETERIRMENEAMKDIIEKKEKKMFRIQEDKEIAKLQRK
jgi:hypothetical protein